MIKVAIIGAGFSGLVLANELKNLGGFEVTFFEKSRGVGGRIATRYNQEWEFDHGVPFFEAKTEKFQVFLQKSIEEGVIASWNLKIVDGFGNEMPCDGKFFIGMPKMNALPKNLARGFDIKFETKICKMERKNDCWHLCDDSLKTYDAFDFVVTSCPPQQAFDILPDECLYKSSLKNFEMLPRFVSLFGFENSFESGVNFSCDIMQITNSKIEKVVCNHKKIGRNNKPSIVVYACDEWSLKNVEMEKELAGQELLAELKNLFGSFENPILSQTHRWLYSQPKFKSDLLSLGDKPLQIISCGDWLSSGDIEGAFLSGIESLKYFLEK